MSVGPRRFALLVMAMSVVSCVGTDGDDESTTVDSPELPAPPDIEVFAAEDHGMLGPRGAVFIAGGGLAVADFGSEAEASNDVVVVGTTGSETGQRITETEVDVDDPGPDTIGESDETVIRPGILGTDASGDVWFSSAMSNVIGRISTSASGDVTTRLIRNGPTSTPETQVMSGPFVFVTDDSGYLWFTNFASDTLGVIDPGALDGATSTIDCAKSECPISVVKIPGMFDKPLGIVLGPDVVGGPQRDLWVTNWGDANTIAVVDPSIRTADRAQYAGLAQVAVDFDTTDPPLPLDSAEPDETRSGPRGIAFAATTADGPIDAVWVTHHDTSSLVRLSLASCGHLPCEIDPGGVIAGSAHPTSIVWNGDADTTAGDRHLYFTNRSGGWIGRLGADATSERHEMAQLGFESACPDGAGGSAIVANGLGEVWFTSFTCQLVGRVTNSP